MCPGVCARRASGVQKGSSTLCVRQVCARRAPGVRVSGVRQVTSVRQVCARRAQTYYQLAGNFMATDLY